jgi:hypothetical protein
MYFCTGEDIEGNYYEFAPAGTTLEEIERECQEYIETLGGGAFDIFDVRDSTDIYLGTVEW